MSKQPEHISHERLPDLPSVPELAVIINVQTKHVSTLALLSTLRHLELPTVVIDCESQDGSFDWFRSLQLEHDFHLIRAPRRPHGVALDWIFQNTTAGPILLVDSDVEVINREMFELMRIRLNGGNVYGSGFLQQGRWLETHYGTDQPLAPGIGFYASRPWIPFSMFCVEPIRRALHAGVSFKHELVLNDFPRLPILSGLLWRRFRFALFRRWRIQGEKPSYIFYDTGSRMHDALSAMGFSFGDVG